jgi:hypothetical protein
MVTKPHQLLQTAYGDATMSQAQAFQWLQQ